MACALLVGWALNDAREASHRTRPAQIAAGRCLDLRASDTRCASPGALFRVVGQRSRSLRCPVRRATAKLLLARAAEARRTELADWCIVINHDRRPK